MKMRRSSAALLSALSLAMVGSDGGSCAAPYEGQECTVTGRNATTIFISCFKDGNPYSDREENSPTEEYPRCQAGAAWPGCKDQ